ncbi:MAG: hypothetical protein K2L39_00145 [Muribaculaceae bacterium]|nr:hypothetical protein [Muribaculaceae bacterium]
MRALLYIFLLTVITGCTCSVPRHERELDEAQSLLGQDAVAALEKLNTFEIEDFGDSSSLARWALLYSEAMAANGLYAPTDTISGIAVEYYSRHRDAASLERVNAARRRMTACSADEGGRLSVFSAMYLAKEKEFQLYKERSMRERYLFAGIALLILAAGVIVWQRQRLRLKRIQNEALVAEASILREDVVRRKSDCSSLESKLSGLLETRFRAMDELCGTYYESQGTKAERKAVAEKVKAQIEELKGDEGMFSEMEVCVNDCQGGMLELLRREWPEIKTDEYRLVVYLACRLSNRSIALLIGESIDVVYKRKSRLKAKISASSMPHSALFLSVF